MIPLREENDPALVQAIVALFDFLEADDHIRQDHGPECDCTTCQDLHGMRYTAEVFLANLQSQATRSPTICEREQTNKRFRVV